MSAPSHRRLVPEASVLQPGALHSPSGSVSDSGELCGVRASQPAEPSRLHADNPALEPREDYVRYGNLELRPSEYQVLIDNQRVGFTRREFEVLLTLAENVDRVVRRAYIYDRVWGREMKYRERAVDVFVRKIRNKLAEAAPGWIYIHTHFAIGYRFFPEPLASGERPTGGDPVRLPRSS